MTFKRRRRLQKRSRLQISPPNPHRSRQVAEAAAPAAPAAKQAAPAKSASSPIEAKMPDIGDFNGRAGDRECFVKVGDTVTAEEAIVVAGNPTRRRWMCRAPALGRGAGRSRHQGRGQGERRVMRFVPCRAKRLRLALRARGLGWGTRRLRLPLNPRHPRPSLRETLSRRERGQKRWPLLEMQWSKRVLRTRLRRPGGAQARARTRRRPGPGQGQRRLRGRIVHR
jgi:hypothetical protein